MNDNHKTHKKGTQSTQKDTKSTKGGAKGGQEIGFPRPCNASTRGLHRRRHRDQFRPLDAEAFAGGSFTRGRDCPCGWPTFGRDVALGGFFLGGGGGGGGGGWGSRGESLGCA